MGFLKGTGTFVGSFANKTQGKKVLSKAKEEGFKKFRFQKKYAPTKKGYKTLIFGK